MRHEDSALGGRESQERLDILTGNIPDILCPNDIQSIFEFYIVGCLDI
jgi:hypothetical protein